jgi:hypothetical protein
MRRLPLFTSSALPASPFAGYGSTSSPTHNSCTSYTSWKLPLAASAASRLSATSVARADLRRFPRKRPASRPTCHRGPWCLGERCGGRDRGVVAAGGRSREVVSPFGHSRAHMALNRHFSGHFVRFVHRFSAISEGRLSPRENRFGLRSETVADVRRRGAGGTLRWRFALTPGGLTLRCWAIGGCISRIRL